MEAISYVQRVTIQAGGQAAMTSDRAQVRWGILGTGRIARAFARGLTFSATGKLMAVGSRQQSTAESFGEEFSLERRYGTYEALLSDPEVEAIYISLPNDLHAEWAKKCAAAGKHILCEKPLAVSREEAESMITAARDADVFLMEAFKDRCHPQMALIKKLVDDGAIGQVRLIDVTFQFTMGAHYDDIRYVDPKGGGAIMDVGCYAAEFVRLITGTEPEFVTGVAKLHPTLGVDEWALANLRFPNDILASLQCGFQVPVHRIGHIWGERGSITLPNIWGPGHDDAIIRIERTGEPMEELSLADGANLFALEADTVARYLDERQAPTMNWADSLGNMAVLDAWRRAVGMRVW